MKSSPSQAVAISPRRGSTARWATKSFVFSSGKEPRKHHPFGPDENLPVGLDLAGRCNMLGLAVPWFVSSSHEQGNESESADPKSQALTLDPTPTLDNLERVGLLKLNGLDNAHSNPYLPWTCWLLEAQRIRSRLHAGF